MTTFLPEWTTWIAAVAMLLILAENALGVTGLALFPDADADGGTDA